MNILEMSKDILLFLMVSSEERKEWIHLFYDFYNYVCY